MFSQPKNCNFCTENLQGTVELQLAVKAKLNLIVLLKEIKTLVTILGKSDGKLSKELPTSYPLLLRILNRCYLSWDPYMANVRDAFPMCYSML